MKVRTDSERVRPRGGWCSSSWPPPSTSRPRPTRCATSSCTPRSPSATARRRRPTRSATASAPATTSSPTARPRPRCTAGQGRQRAVRPRLLEVHPLLQVRRRLRRAVPEHVRDRGRRPRLRRAHLDRVRGRAAGLGLRLLRQLHRRLPHRRADVPRRARAARGRRVGRGRPDRDRRRSARTAASAAPSSCTCRTTEIVKVTSPDDHDVTRGNLCIKGRFGFEHVQALATMAAVDRPPRAARRPERGSWPSTAPDGAAPPRPPGHRGAARDPRRGPGQAPCRSRSPCARRATTSSSPPGFLRHRGPDRRRATRSRRSATAPTSSAPSSTTTC